MPNPRHARADKAVSQLPDKVDVRLPKGQLETVDKDG
jgi:hypothetical protein